MAPGVAGNWQLVTATSSVLPQLLLGQGDAGLGLIGVLQVVGLGVGVQRLLPLLGLGGGLAIGQVLVVELVAGAGQGRLGLLGLVPGQRLGVSVEGLLPVA